MEIDIKANIEYGEEMNEVDNFIKENCQNQKTILGNNVFETILFKRIFINEENNTHEF